MPSFRPTTPYSKEVEPTPSEEHKARIQRTMGIPAMDYQKMAKLRGAPYNFTSGYRSQDEDTLSDLYSMGTLFPATVPGAGGIAVGQSKAPPMDAPSAASKTMAPTAMAMAPTPRAASTSVAKSVNTKKPVAPIADVSPADILKRKTDLESEMYQQGMGIAPANLKNAMSAYNTPTTPTIPDIGKSIKERIKSSVAAPDMAKAAGDLPKTKSGMKKFMDEYGKFIALGALAGTGGKGGAIAAPIMAALPGILKMLQNRGKKTSGAPSKFQGYSEYDAMTAPQNAAHGGLLGNKSAAHPKKKMSGGSIRKFSGGVMKKVTKKFAEGGESKSDKRESAFRRLEDEDLRDDSISKNLDKEKVRKFFGLLNDRRPSDVIEPNMQESLNDDYMKKQLGSIVDEMYNSKNRMSARGGFDDNEYVVNDYSYERPIVSGMSDKKYRGTAGVPYDSPSFKARQARHINPSVKVSVDKTSKKMVGGTVRKFKGGSMNTMKENLMPKYKHGGDMPKGMPKEMMAMMGKKGKATGDMPEHKKMDMGMPIGNMPDPKKMGMAKPKPSSMDQKFAKGGTAKYASGGMCKGYGIAKKIRSTGVMN